ncbi:hypothetical protein B0H10DRAFT_433133 [Mycena sp. CBHHK59/15]|nr:hypothetical protein B0H10DRAFT_433133 [Mycena sp. CBHHK59/15]
MPSFLSKVFGRKKDDTKESRSQHRASSDAPLLEGKFEAVPPTISPTSARFEDSAEATSNDKEKERDGFGLFKTKPKASPAVTPDQSQSVAQRKVLDYHLSLNLPGPKEESTRALGVVFEADPDAQILLPESVIAERRLSPLEAFLLVQACSQAINARGLESLGIMIPHWYSASLSAQRKLISLFIQSLALKSPITTLSPTASSPVSAFESEISATRSPHDVAAVLRWGLRHLQLDNSSFGKDEQWYTQFLDAEKASEYPPKAFTEKLVPLLPPTHLHLLTATLEIFSSLAAHAEANSISGSKLSKMLGFWILSTPRVVDGDDCLSFYARWEKWGRVLEHLFLARIRDEAADHRMPTRLMELVNHYPYAKSSSPDSDATFLPQPRFSTRRYDALFVRIETEVSSTEAKKHRNHPLRLIADALKASSQSLSPDATPTSSVERDLWESLKKHVSVTDTDSESYPGLSSLFADETIRFLSLIPTSGDTEAKPQDPPPFTLFIPSSTVGRRRSMSLSDRDTAAATVASAHAKAASSASSSDSHGQPSTIPSGSVGVDWSQFSTSGFFAENGTSNGAKLAETLLDNKDVEVTIPRKLSARRKLPPALIPLPSAPGNRGKSLDLPGKETKEVKQGKSKATKFEIMQLDEAFIDFWSDALLDPISADWPGFVVCKIKSSVPALNAADGKRVGWLIIEQRFFTPSPPPASPTATDVSQARPRPTSPKPSFQSDSKSTKKKRFSFFTSLSGSSPAQSSASVNSKTEGTKGRKKAAKGPKIGEMGEILKEEEEPSQSTGKTNGTGPNVLSAVATGVVAASAAATVVTSVQETPKDTAPTSASVSSALVEDVANAQVTSPHATEEPQSTVVADATPSFVQDVANVQVRHPDAEPAIDQKTTENSVDEPAVDAEPTPAAAVIVAEQVVPEPEPVVEEPAVKAQPTPEAVITHEPTPPPAPGKEAEPAPPIEELVVEEPEVSAPVEEPVVIARVPTPSSPAATEESAVKETSPPVEEPVVIEREVTPPAPMIAEPEAALPLQEPIVEEVRAPSPPVEEPAIIEREPTPPPAVEAESAPSVEEVIIEEEPAPLPTVVEPVLETAPVFEEPLAPAEPAVIEQEPTPPPAVAEPEPEPDAPIEEPVVEEEPVAPAAVAEPALAAEEPEPSPPPVQELIPESEPSPLVEEPTPPLPVVEELEPPVVEVAPVEGVEDAPVESSLSVAEETAVVDPELSMPEEQPEVRLINEDLSPLRSP